MFNGPDDKPFWDRAFNGNVNKKVPTVDEVWEKARAYFAWMDTHPLQEEQLFHYKGDVTSHAASKMRAYTWDGFAVFLGMTKQGVQLWRNGDHGEDLKELMEYIGQIIYTQKFEGAAANLLNSGLITRDLGLAERRELTGANGGPIETSEVSPREILASRLAALATNLGEDEAPSESD